MFHDNCWAIRLIAALLLTFMSHIRPVPSPPGGFGGLSLPKQCSKPPKLKYENYKQVQFCQFLQCEGINRETKKLTPTITWGDLHVGATWPPLLSGWKSPGVVIPGVWVIFVENLKVINAGKCSHCWHWQLARDLVLSCFDGGQVPQRCLVTKFMSSIKCFGLLPQVHAQQGASLFWLSQCSRNFNWEKGSTRFIMSSIECFDPSPQVHTQQGAVSFWLQILSFGGEGVIQGLHSCDLLPCWLRSKVAVVAC